MSFSIKSHFSFFLRVIFLLFFVFQNTFVLENQKTTGLYAQTPILEWRFDKITSQDGLSQNTVTCMLQDNLGFIWMGTQNGLNRYDASSFKIYKPQKNKTSLPDNHITYLLQTEDNFIWIGTQNGGLARLNTITEEFETFSHNSQNPLSLSAGIVTCILEDSKGRLWVGTSVGGLNLFNPTSKTFDHYRNDEKNQNSIAQNHITDLIEDYQKRLWVATADGGLDRFEESENKFVHFRPSIYGSSSSAPSSEQIVGLEVLNNTNSKNTALSNKLWVATRDGGINILDLDTEIFTVLEANEKRTIDKAGKPTTSNLFSGKIVTTFKSFENEIFVGTQEDGVLIINALTNQIKRLESNPSLRYSLSNNHITSIFKDNQNSIWIGTLAEGVNKFNPIKNKFAHFREEADKTGSLPDSRITSIIKSKNNNLWIGTASGGVAVLLKENIKERIFKTYQHRENDKTTIASDKVSVIYEDHQNQIWIGTSEGLEKFNADKNIFEEVVLYNEKLSQSNKLSVKAIHQDTKNNYWIGLYQQGLLKISPTGETKLFKTEPYNDFSLSNDYVRVIFEDRIGNLWIGTEDGLNLYDNSPNSEKFVRYMHQIENPNSISNDEILSITEDDNGNIWVGTANGLNKFDVKNGIFTTLTEKEGLPNNIIHGVVCDLQNRIWVSTSQGIAELDPYSKTIRSYDISDGLQSNEFISGSSFQEKIIVDGEEKQGFIYFGGINGYNRFNPDSLSYNTDVPKLVFTQFSLFNQPLSPSNKDSYLEKTIPYTNQIELPYDANVFSIEFSVLDFIAPHKTTYSYYLEGFDKEWHTTSRNFVTYTNLASGNYTLKVKGSNSDGIWNDTGIEMSIIVTPPFWRTWWFISLSFFFSLAAVIGGYRIRTYQIQEQKRRLEYQVEERTNELAEKTWELENQTKQLESQNALLEKQSKEIQVAYDNVNTLSEVGQKITSTLDMRQMIETVFQNVSNLMPVDRFGIGVFNEESQRIEFPFFVEEETYFPFHTKSLRDKKRLSVICYENQKEICINDFEKENKNYGTDGIEMELGKTPKSAAYFPLSVEQHAIGILTVQSFQKNAYSEQQLTILRSLAAYTSIALDNARAYKTIETNNRNITDSIRYALTIQQAMLPERELLSSLFEEHFVIFKPLSMVSGDFYWVTKVENRTYAAIIDCTGHGVPGGFMSVIGKTLLDEIVQTQQIKEPAKVLEILDKNTRAVLKQDQTSNDDGMDIALFCIEDSPTDEKIKITFSGAKRPLYYVEDSKIEVIKGDRRSIGGRLRNNPIPFTNNECLVKKGTQIYLTTDGFADQPNTERKKIGSLGLRKFIEHNASNDMEKQRMNLLKLLREHQQESAQVDDISLIGLRV
ncbi:two-component regulator propeller domain-containing protein [Bernardetia sp.]|uniref:two-component regulator propeller domain-containing protein n=1 Tax=Bernardetia sp. TaxID=1937974 RepID=UPI0025BA2069|nr:two-component regulator propeller domain-containing protein [Bernardetia sp.]